MQRRGNHIGGLANTPAPAPGAPQEGLLSKPWMALRWALLPARPAADAPPGEAGAEAGAGPAQPLGGDHSDDEQLAASDEVG